MSRGSENGLSPVAQDARVGRGDSAVALGLRLLSVGPLLILVLLVIGIALVTPAFLKPVNLGNILAQTSVIAIVAMGQQLVILTRGIDLSVGSNLALCLLTLRLGGRDGDKQLQRRVQA